MVRQAHIPGQGAVDMQQAGGQVQLVLFVDGTGMEYASPGVAVGLAEG